MKSNNNQNIINKNNNEDHNIMSYSIFLEKKQENDKLSIPNKKYKWVDDDTVVSCLNCSRTFTLFLRKHHCRFCGKIFCSNCITLKQITPIDLLCEDSLKGTWNEYLSSYIFSKDNKKHKVCNPCSELLDFIDSVKKIIDVLMIAKFDISILKSMSQVCKSWNNAANYLLVLLREIQYKLPTDKISQFEKSLMWKNIDYLIGHNKYMFQLIKSCDNDVEYNIIINKLSQKPCVSCWTMMCSRNCSDRFTSFDAISLIHLGFNNVSGSDIIKKLALDYLVCSDKEFKCYLPLLVYYLRNDTKDSILCDFLIKRCLNNFNLLNSLYWELQLYPKDLYDEDVYFNTLNKLKELFKDKANESNFVKILEGYSFVKVIENISSAICDNDKKYDEIKDTFNLTGMLSCPLNYHLKIKNINIDKIRIKDSATKPLLIPCDTHNGTTLNILYKKEDIRKDQIIMNLIQLIDIILKKEESLDLGVITYNILPTSKNSGLIEIINDCDTIYYIQEKLNSTILNYILDQNDAMKVKDIRDVFIKSTAIYCVITYIFGIGDRHLDNIMVTRTGKLFHIDYGYILGDDPVRSNPGIRITPEILEAMGGVNSKNYNDFTELCTKIYNCLRRNIDIFMVMLMSLPKLSDIKISEDDIKELLIKRFIPGANQVDAKLHLVSQLEKSSYVDKIKDWFHYHSKEKTVSSAMNRLTYAVSNLIVSGVQQIPVKSNYQDKKI